MKNYSVIRLIVASPGDVLQECAALEEVVGELNAATARAYNIHLQLAHWKTDAYPGFHLDGVQGLIDPILNIEECDVFIGIFWKRFGTPTMNAQSGTEHEFSKAYDFWRKKGHPHIMFYFNQCAYSPSSIEEIQQWGQVLEFKKNFPKEGLWWQYDGEIHFEKLVRSHLTRLIIDRFNRGETDNYSNGEEYHRLPQIEELTAKVQTQLFTEKEQFERLCGEIERQLDEFKIIPATGVARAVLIQENYELALRLFDFLLHKASPLDKDLYIVYGNIGYCLSGMGYYQEANEYFQHVKTFNENKTYFAWHAVAAAYCHWKLGRMNEYRQELNLAKTKPEYRKSIKLYRKLYPEIISDLY